MNSSKTLVIDQSVVEHATSPKFTKTTTMTNSINTSTSNSHQGLTFGISSILASSNSLSTSSLESVAEVLSSNSLSTVSDFNLETTSKQQIPECSPFTLQSCSVCPINRSEAFWPEMLSLQQYNTLLGRLSVETLAAGHTNVVPSSSGTSSSGINSNGISSSGTSCNSSIDARMISTSSSTSSPSAFTAAPSTIAMPPANSFQSAAHCSFSPADTVFAKSLPPPPPPTTSDAATNDSSKAFSLIHNAITAPFQSYPSMFESSMTNNLLKYIPSINMNTNIYSMNNPFFFPNISDAYLFENKYLTNMQLQNSNFDHENNNNSVNDNALDCPIDIETIETENNFDSKSNKRKRSWSRAVFTSSQRRVLEHYFNIYKYIAKPERNNLAAILGLTDAQIKIWFQNRRMKWRRKFNYKLLIKNLPILNNTSQPIFGIRFNSASVPTNHLNNDQLLQSKFYKPNPSGARIKKTVSDSH